MNNDIIDLYERNARAWASQRGRDLFEKPWLDLFAGHLSAGGSILDIGCGSGEPVARYFLDCGYEVSGIDSSPSLIAICRDAFPYRTWTTADMRSLDLARTFDGLLAWHSLFHLSPDDQIAMFPTFRNHAKSGTALMFTSGPQRGVSIGQWCGEPLYHGSLDPDEYRHHLDANGFDVVDHVVSDPGCGHATVWLARAR